MALNTKINLTDLPPKYTTTLYNNIRLSVLRSSRSLISDIDSKTKAFPCGKDVINGLSGYPDQDRSSKVERKQTIARIKLDAQRRLKHC